MDSAPAAGLRLFSAAVVRRFLGLFLPVALLTCGAVVALYAHDLEAERARHEQSGWHVIDLQAAIITREMEAIEGDLLYLADAAVLRDFLAATPNSRPRLEEEYILFARRKGVYDQIRFLDTTGREQVRVNLNSGQASAVAQAELQTKAGRYYFVQTMLRGRGEVFVSPFDLNVEHEKIERPLKPTIRFATPVFDREGRKRGILVLNYLGAALLGKLAEVSVSSPGSAWLLNRSGQFLRGPSPEDEWGFMLGHERSFPASWPTEWEQLRARVRGQFHTTGGLFTFWALPSRGWNPVVRDPGSGSADPDAGDPGLIVLSHIPASVLDARARVLLFRLLLFSSLALLLLLVLSWYLAHAGALRRSHEARLEESEARLRALSSRLLTAQEEERRSLARDLHDELGQVVTAITLDLQRASQAPDPSRKNELIGHGLVGAGRMLEQIHEITARVRPPLLDDLGLKAAIQSLLSDYEHRTGIAVGAELHFDAPVPATISENVYRILQEALTNVSRHARATEVRIVLHATDAEVSLTVRDDGVGFAPECLDGTRLGLLGMRERAELLQGTFRLQAMPGSGTAVCIVIPTGGRARMEQPLAPGGLT